MKKLLGGLLAGGLAGLLAGFGLGIFTFPYLFPPPELHEMAPDRQPEDILARGVFIHANPDDPVHYGAGNVVAYADILHIEDNFRVGPGPKYHVYLVPYPDIRPDSPVNEMMYVDLGRLKAFSGSQNYLVPAGLDIRDFRSVVIWCEQFNVLISPATLHATNHDI